MPRRFTRWRHAAGRTLQRGTDVRAWPLAVRVVTVTTLLALLSILAVGVYLSTIIADGLYEQRRDRVLEETVDVRGALTDTLTQLPGATSTQQQDAAFAFVQDTGGQGDAARREVALVPADTSGTVLSVASDQDLLGLVDSDLEDSVAEHPDALVWRSVGLPGSGHPETPALIVGTRVTVAGVGAYDLYVLYPLQEEQQTLSFVQQVMLGGGAVLLALVVGIAIVVARLVTMPLRRAAEAAERMSAGDLATRVRVSGGDELAQVGRSFNELATNLEQKVDDLTELSRVQHRFVSDVSHELRTPLTTIRMAASVLDNRREELPGDLRRTTELLSTQVERFDVLLADLLEISRFDAGAAELEAHREEIDEIVRRAAENAAPLAAARGCTLELRLADRGTGAVVDARRIDRILRNLLTNAIEHGAGEPVIVRTAASADAVAVVVQDFGRGMSPADARRVFDRFWRADPSRARTLGGTGLGLSISVEDAHLHGGWLQAWGQEGKGAVFRLTLPRRPGTELTRSPLRLERSFDRSELDEEPLPITGEIRIGPGRLPDLPPAPRPSADEETP